MGSEGTEAKGYDHGYDGEVFYLGLALDPAYIEGWVEGCLERSVRPIQKMNRSSATFGRTRPRRSW